MKKICGQGQYLNPKHSQVIEGRNFTRGDNSGKTKNRHQLLFHEECIHEVSRRYLDAPYIHTYIHIYKPKQICPHFFKVGA